MNFIELESQQKLRGGFYTDPLIASFLVRWVAGITPTHVLEPSCGDGVFLSVLQEQQLPKSTQIVAFEINEEEAQKAAIRTKLRVDVHNLDFLAWYLLNTPNERAFDAIVGNPPFIRYQYLPARQQALAGKIFERLSLPFTKHTNAWVPFVLASIQLLRPGGRLAMVIPSEVLHIPHAQSLRRYLAEQCSRILIVDPEEIWFSGTLQGTVLLLAEKKSHPSKMGHGVGVVSVKSRAALTRDPEELFSNVLYANGVTIEGKWMPVFLSAHERELIAILKHHSKVKVFSDVASVDVGIVTGANKFFLVPDDVVDKHGLDTWAHPMFGRSDHVKGLVYTNKDHRTNRQLGLPANFLWFKEEQLRQLPNNVKRYLADGVRQGLDKRYKCRVRKTWFEVPSVYVAPIAMLKRAHNYPRLVLNKAKAYTTDTAYRIRPLNVKPETLVFGFVNSLTCLSAEMEGRHYGGGVLELVPSEIERLLVPIIEIDKKALEDADKIFRQSNSYSEFLRRQDSIILKDLGLSDEDTDTLYSAWQRLKDRRHRIPTTDAAESAPETV